MIKTSSIVVFYVNQPELLIESLSLFKCMQLGEDAFFLEENLSINCSSDLYSKWSYGLGIPMVAFWGLVYPLFLAFRIYFKLKSSKNDQKKRLEVISHYSFILGGYNEKYIYWEFIILIRKFAMILVVLGFGYESEDSSTPALMLMIILGLSLYANIKFKPYQSSLTTRLETMSLVAVVIMI